MHMCWNLSINRHIAVILTFKGFLIQPRVRRCGNLFSTTWAMSLSRSSTAMRLDISSGHAFVVVHKLTSTFEWATQRSLVNLTMGRCLCWVTEPTVGGVTSKNVLLKYLNSSSILEFLSIFPERFTNYQIFLSYQDEKLGDWTYLCPYLPHLVVTERTTLRLTSKMSVSQLKMAHCGENYEWHGPRGPLWIYEVIIGRM